MADGRVPFDKAKEDFMNHVWPPEFNEVHWMQDWEVENFLAKVEEGRKKKDVGSSALSQQIRDQIMDLLKTSNKYKNEKATEALINLRSAHSDIHLADFATIVNLEIVEPDEALTLVPTLKDTKYALVENEQDLRYLLDELKKLREENDA